MMTVFADISPGTFVDAWDECTNTWRMGIVTSISARTNTVNVRLDGRRDSLDTPVELKLQELADFRRYSRLHANQHNLGLPEWQISSKQLASLETHLKSLKLGTGDAHATTQLLRGRLFTAVEILLTQKYSRKSDRIRAVKFLDAVIIYICSWLKQFPELALLIHSGDARPDLFLSDDEVAVAMAWPELMLTLARLFRADAGTCNFSMPFPANFSSRFVSNKEDYFLHQFGELGGFSLASQMLVLQAEHKLSIDLISQLPLFRVGHFLLKEFREEWGKEFLELTRKQVKAIEPNEIECLDLTVLDEFEKHIRTFVESINHSAKLKYDRIWQTIIVKLLRCKSQEKNARGMKELNDLTLTVCRRIDVRYQQRFTQWLLKHRLFELVLTPPYPDRLRLLDTLFQHLVGQDEVSAGCFAVLWKLARHCYESPSDSDILSLILSFPSRIAQILVHSGEDARQHSLSLIKDFFARFPQTYAEQTVELLICNTQEYMKLTRKRSDFLGPDAKHTENIKDRLELIRFLSMQWHCRLSLKQFEVLCDAFVVGPVSRSDSDYFYSWTEAACSTVLSPLRVTEVFEKFFCEQLHPQQLTQAAYQCFYKLFCVANAYCANIKEQQGIITARAAVNLIGERTLFRFLVEVEDPKVQEQVQDLLVHLNSCLSIVPTVGKRLIWSKLLDCLYRHIEQPKQRRCILKLLYSAIRSSRFKNPASPEAHRAQGNSTDELTLRDFASKNDRLLSILLSMVEKCQDTDLACIILHELSVNQRATMIQCERGTQSSLRGSKTWFGIAAIAGAMIAAGFLHCAKPQK